MNKDRIRVMLCDDFEEELNSMSVCYLLLKRLSFNEQWRILNYLLVRLWGRGWSLSKPASDNTGGK